jgi:hypothetical protein
MKHTLSTIAILLFTFVNVATINAQTIIPANNCGKVIANEENVTHVSSSYCAEYGAGGSATNMFGVAWSIGLDGVKFAIGDEHGVLPETPAISVPAGYSSVTNPCIMVGTEGGPGTFLWVAVTYLARSATGTADLFMDIYPATNTFAGGLSYTSSFGAPEVGIQLTSSGTVSEIAQPRGDVINQLDNGRVLSNWFTLTWVENGTVHVMADNFRDVYSHQTSNMAMARYCTITGSADLGYPDVAGIQRTQGSSFDRIALITYMDFSYNIYYQEWNISSSELSAANIVVPDGKEPRIDAIDLYTLNGTSSTAPRYNITYRDGNSAIYQYNDKAATPTLLITQLAFPNYFVTAPSTVCGPGNSYTTIYRVMNGDDIYAQQTSGMTGLPVSADYHTVNCNDYKTNVDPSASQLDNVPAMPATVFVCGYDNVSKTIWYNTAGDPLTFSTDGTESVKNTINTSHAEWQVTPNPAYDALNLASDASTTGTYTITDVMGRSVGNGKVSGSANTIDIGKLQAGMYYIKVSQGQWPVQALSFQKL